MMRRLLNTIIIVLTTLASLVAQSPTQNALGTAPVASSDNALTVLENTKTVGGSETTVIKYLSASQARQLVRSAFSLLREYSVSVDDEITGSFTEKTAVEKAAAAKKIETAVAVSTTPSFETLSQLPDEKFEQYLVGMEQILQKKIKIAETTEYSSIAAKTERQALLSRLQSIMRSATCLVNKNEGIFIKTSDLDGNDIIAFRLDSLRSNARYSLVENYREGLARIRKDQVYGFLNYCGEEVVPAQYEFAEAFNSGRALVKKVNWYFIQANGEESDALENIADAKALKNGISIVKLTNGKFTFIKNDYDKTKQYSAAQYDNIEPFYKKEFFKVQNLKKQGLIALDGTVRLQPIYDVIEPLQTMGLYRIKLEEKWGIMDSIGNIKFSTDFTSISNFDKFGIATAQDEKGVHLLNAKDFTLTRGYASISTVNAYGLATVRDNETKLFGLINDKLEVVMKPVYASLGAYNQYGLAQACIAPSACGYIDTKAQEVIPMSYTDVTDFNSQGLVVAKGIDASCTSGKCSYETILDRKGKTVLAKALKNADKIHYELQDSVFSQNYISVRVSEGGEAGFQLINKNNFQLINTTPYKVIYHVDIYGLIRVVNSENLQGIMDTTGKVIAKCSYKEIKRPNENYYPVKDDKGKWGFIDKKGKPQIPFEYDEVRNFRLGYTIVQKGKEFGVINRFNAKVVPCAFKTAVLSDQQKYVLTEENGNEIILNDKLDCEKNCTRLDEIRRVESGGK
jgi:hypothetical protein